MGREKVGVAVEVERRRLEVLGHVLDVFRDMD
jgi:hypothetical protein